MNDVAETPSPSTLAGARLVQFNLIATAVFTASALLAAIVFDSATRIQGVVVSLTLFAIGVWVFLWSYWSAVQRSRIDSIAVAQLYFLTGDVVPPFQKRAMSLALTVQVVVSLATALARPSTDGDPGSTLAFGILVPMLGLGLNGLLAARHGRFTPRREATSHSESPTSTDSDAEIPPVDPEMEQNASHG